MNYDGPTILVISGTHGNETNAVQDVYDFKLKMNSLGKDYIQFHQAWNVTGLNACTRNFQEENVEIPDDLNRAFFDKKPADKEAAIKLIKDLVAGADIVLDVHNSDLLLNCVVINNDCYAKGYVDFCKENKIPYILLESTTNTIKKYAIQHSSVGFTVEIGDMNFSESNDGVAFLEKLVNCLEEEDLAQFRIASDPYNTLQVAQDIISHSRGLLRVRDSSGKHIKPKRSEVLRHYLKGDVIFDVLDPVEDCIVETITAPCSCYLMDLVDSYWTDIGNPIGTIQPDLED